MMLDRTNQKKPFPSMIHSVGDILVVSQSEESSSRMPNSLDGGGLNSCVVTGESAFINRAGSVDLKVFQSKLMLKSPRPQQNFQIVRVLAWCISVAWAVGAHYHFVHLIGSVDEQEDVWVQFTEAAEPCRIFLFAYSVTFAGFTILIAGIVSVVVFRHYKEPRFRKLLPQFLFHICSLGILVPVVTLGRQLYCIYYIELGESKVTQVFASFCEATAIGWLLYALVARLCVMYSVYVRGRYDVQYKWVLLRIVIQNGFFHLAYLAHLLPPKYIWIQSTGLRLALVCIILEVVYYLACLRNTRYAVEDFRCLRYLCIYGGIMFTLGSVLPVLNPLARNMDQFNAAILFLWGLGIEILGPPLWDLFRSYMEWQYEFVECNVLETFSDNIKDALDDPLLYPIILSCAQKRFCDENIKFLHGGYSILTTVVNLQNDNKPSDCSLEDRVNELLKTYVVVGASTPVNLASKHLTKFRQIHAELNSAGDRHLDLAKLEIVLSQSLRDIFELLDSSGVLTMYNKSPEKIVIDAERAALIRLEAGSY